MTTTSIQISYEGMATEDAPSCLLCGTVGSPLHPAPCDRVFGAPGVWRMVECRRCDFAWLDPRPTPIDFGKAYATHDTPNLSSVGLRGFEPDLRGPEAIQLVLQAGASGDRDEAFVLDIRPGEKLYEKLSFKGAHVEQAGSGAAQLQRVRSVHRALE